MSLATLLPWLLAARVVLSVTSSGLQKSQLNAGVGTGAFWRGTYAWMLPAGIVAALVDSRADAWVSSAFWINALLAGAIDAAGNRVMLSALRRTDLSVFGPLTALRPVLAMLFGWAFLAEHPSGLGAAGVAVTGAGAVLLMAREGSTNPGRRIDFQSLALRGGGIALSTFASVFLKRAAVAGTPGMTLGVWIVAGTVALGIGQRVRPGPPTTPRPDLTSRPKPAIAVHAATFFAMQWLTIVVFQHSLLAYSFAFFQVAMVLQVVVGRVVFGEPAFGRRLAGCAVMGAGAALIAWKG